MDQHVRHPVPGHQATALRPLGAVEQMIGAATVGGRIHLLHTSFTPIPNLLEAAEEILLEAID